MKKKLSWFIFSLLIATLGLVFSLRTSPAASSDNLNVVFFDVGQGDAILITAPQGQTILVDGGEGGKVVSKLGKYLPFYQRKIDFVFLTHPHADHLDGLIPVLEKYQVGQILYSGVPHTTETFFEWLKFVKNKNIPLKIIAHPETMTLAQDVTIDFLYPNRDLTNAALNAAEESKDGKLNELNNTSLVFRLNYGQTSFLFMGDAETPVEQELLRCDDIGNPDAYRGSLQSNVLKVAHHGSHSSTGEEFLEAVKPEIAVISVGKNNDFGHPHLRTLRRLERFGAQILRTDEVGDIQIESDGQKMKVK